MSQLSDPIGFKDEKIVGCSVCKNPTRMTGTRLCDRCWELVTRIKHDLRLAEKIIKMVEGGEL